MREWSDALFLSLSALFKYRISSVSVWTVLRSEVAEGMDDGVPWYWVRNAPLSGCANGSYRHVLAPQLCACVEAMYSGQRQTKV